jgi:hypothetical protein
MTADELIAYLSLVPGDTPVAVRGEEGDWNENVVVWKEVLPAGDVKFRIDCR